MKYLSAVIFSLLLFSCSITNFTLRKQTEVSYGVSGNFVIRLDPIASVYTDPTLPYVIYVTQEKGNYDVFTTLKSNRTVQSIASTPYDETDALGIDEKRFLYISREFDIRGDVVVKDEKNISIVSDKDNACITPAISPGRVYAAYIVRVGNEYKPVLYTIGSGAQKIIQLDECRYPAFPDDEHFYYITGNSIYLYDIAGNKRALTVDSPSLKYFLTVDHSDGTLYYIAVPYDTNRDGIIDETDSKFITRFQNGRETYLFPVNDIKRFAFDAKYLYYVDGTIIKYHDKTALVPEFSTIFHYVTYIEQQRSVEKKLIAYNYALTKFASEPRAEDLYRDYLMFLKNAGLTDLFNREVAVVRSTYPPKSRLYYFADSISKETIEPNKEYYDYYIELRLERHYSEKQYSQYVRFFDQQRRMTHLPKRTVNKLTYYYGMSLAKLGEFEKAKTAFVNLTQNTLTKDEWIDLSVEALIQLSRTSDTGIASVNYLEQLKLQHKDTAFIYTKASIEIARNYVQLGDTETAERELNETMDKFGDEDLKDDITAELLNVYSKQKNYEKGFEAAKKRIDEGYTGLRYNDYISYIERYGVQVAHDYYLKNDLLQAKKWYAAVVQYSPQERTANRGLIEVNYALGNILPLAGQYKETYVKNSSDPAAGYFYAYSLTYVGSYFASLNKPEHELAAYQEAYTVLKAAIEIKPDEPFFFLTLGWIEEQFERLNTGNFLEIALEHYKTGLALATDPIVQGYFHKNIGNVYYELKLNSLALEHYTLMEKVIPAYSTEREKIGYFLKLSDIYYQTDDYSKALELDKEVALYYETQKNYAGMVFIYKHMGLLHHQKQEYLKAADMFTKALRTAETQGISDNTTLLYRNIAYNALLGTDEDRAIEASIKGIETIVDVKQVKKGSLLSVFVDVSLSAESSSAYKGLTPDMERDLFYTILARAYQAKGNFKKALEYYGEKKKKNLQPYAASIIANNLADMYYRLSAEADMRAYITESLAIADKEQFLKGVIVNELSLYYLKDTVTFEDMQKLEAFAVKVSAVKDASLSAAYKIIYIFAAYNYALQDHTFSTPEQASEMMLYRFQLISKMTMFTQELEKTQKPSEPFTRLRLIFNYMFLGTDITKDLELLSADPKYGFLCRYDLALMAADNGDLTTAAAHLRLLTDSLSTADPFKQSDALYFWQVNKERLYLLAETIARSGDARSAADLVLSFEDIEAYLSYCMYKPILASQFDTVNIGNYLYALSQKNTAEADQYRAQLDSPARLLTGTLRLRSSDIQSIVSGTDVLSCRLGSGYLQITGTAVTYTDKADGKLICDRTGLSFAPDAFNAYSLSQMYVLYGKRIIKTAYAPLPVSQLAEKKGGCYTLAEPLTLQPVYLDSSFGTIALRDIAANGVTIDGIAFNTVSAELLKPATDLLIYCGVAELTVNGKPLSYRPMTDTEITTYITTVLTQKDTRAQAYYQLGYYNKSFQELQNVVRFARLKGDNEYLSQKLLTLITIGANMLGDPDSVKEYLDEYLKLKGDATPGTYNERLASLYERNGFYKKAIELFETGKLPKNDYRVGVLYEKMGDMQKAMAFLKPIQTDEARLERAKICYKFLNDYTAAEAELSGITDKKYDAVKRLYTAFIATNKGEHDTALSLFDTFITGVDPKNALSINARIGQAQVYYEKSNYFKALRIASDVLKDMPDKSMFEERVVVNNLRALCYIEVGRLDAASEILDIAYKDASDKNIIAQLPVIAVNKAVILRKRGDYDKALQELQRNETYFAERENRLILSGIYRNIGITAYEKGNFPLALQYFSKIRVMNGAEIKKDLIFAHYYTGLIQKDPAVLQQGIDLGKELKNEKMLLKLYSALGTLRRDTVQLEKAREMIDTIQEKIKIFDLRKSFFKENISVYDELIRLYCEKNEPERAFELIESVKLIGFSMAMNDDLAFMVSDQKISAHLKEMKERVEYLQYQAQNNPDWKAEYEKAKMEYDTYKINLFVEFGDSLAYKPFAVTKASDIQGMLGDAVGISYYTIGTTLYAIYISQNTITVKTIQLTGNDLDVSVTLFRDAVITEKSEDIIKERGRALYTLLLDPLQLSRSKQWIISPSGVLNYLPFAALHNGRSYLIEEAMITYVPGFNALQKKEPNLSQTVLAIGNPDVDNPSLELYFAQKEAREIDFMYGRYGEVYIGKDATETQVKKSLDGGTYQTVHLACHGVFNKENPAFSFLYLRSDGENNGRLDIEEILGMHVKADLVVLSACETAVGSLGKGDEVMALDRAFLNAGSTAVISALWRISDVATAMLFKKYYRYRKDGISQSEALQKAASDLRAFFPHPVYWAALKYTGR